MSDLNELPRINPDIKERWLTALRSGEYVQAEGELRRGDGFCCLGVLCDILSEDLDTEWTVRTFWNDRSRSAYEFAGQYTTLPLRVERLIGLDPDSFMNFTPLTTRNDGIDGSSKHSFAEIADIIEGHC